MNIITLPVNIGYLDIKYTISLHIAIFDRITF